MHYWTVTNKKGNITRSVHLYFKTRAALLFQMLKILDLIENPMYVQLASIYRWETPACAS